MIIMDADLLQRIFGEHWKYITAVLIVITALIIWKIIKRSSNDNWLSKAQKRQQKRYEYTDPAGPYYPTDTQINWRAHYKKLKKQQPQTPPIYQAQHGEWSPTGWRYDADTQQWEPPDYLTEESRQKWKWDPEKKIWIDLEKQQQIRHPAPDPRIKKASNEPSYEEWKNQRYKEIYEQLTEEAEQQKKIPGVNPGIFLYENEVPTVCPE